MIMVQGKFLVLTSSGDQWLHSGYILKVGPIRLGDLLTVEPEREGDIKTDANLFGPEQWEAWCYHWLVGN